MKPRPPKPKKSPYEESRDRVLRDLDTTGLPWPAKPKGYAEEYEFPQDITVLSSAALGKLQSKLAGWSGYAQRLIGLVDIDLTVAETRFTIKLNEKMSELQANGSARKLKDTLKAQALAANPGLKVAAYALGEKTSLLGALKAQKSIYDDQRNAASREQSRRSDELRLRR